MKKIHNQFLFVLIILILCVFNFKSTAQNFDNYTNIKSSGKIPSDFLILSSSKFEADKGTIDKNEKDFIRRSKKDFYLESNFMVDELLHNGKVLYNDPIGVYLNKIVSNILVNKPELQKKIRVYVVLSDIINAYTSNNGIIFMNIGLLAKLETEAQLAFVLGHEITHYEKSHVLNRYVLNEQIQRKKLKINYSDSDIETILFSKTSYEKTQEIEADIESTKLLLGTQYNPRAGAEVMRLFASEIPFTVKYHFSPAFFSMDSTIKFNFSPIDLNALTYEEKFDQDGKTHPALSERIKTIEALSDSIHPGKTDFILPEEDFYRIQKTAQFEVSKLFIQNGNFYYAFYSIYKLLQENPDSRYLKDLLCKTYYLIAKSSLRNSDLKVPFIVYEQPIEIQWIIQHFEQLSSGELNVLSTYTYLKMYPTPDILKKEIRLKDLLYDMQYEFGDGYSFEHIPSGQDSIKAIPFVSAYLSSLSSKSTVSHTLTEDVIYSAKHNNASTSEVISAKIDNIIILDPTYKKYDLRRKSQQKYIASEKSLLAYNNQIRLISDKLDISDTIVSSIGWSENDTISFQNHSIFKRHVEELFTNGSNIVTTDFELVDTTCNVYNSNHLALMGTYSFHIQKHIITKIIVLVWSGFLFPTFPLGLYYVVTPSYRTYTYLITINSKNQAIDFESVRQLKFRDSKGAINSSTYYQLLKMKKGK